ncbi:phosphatase PAP2 family protein [Oligoflexia bacterium]|nr:phosphatase PAP2 family protein [Oligoflexia bacterium]
MPLSDWDASILNTLATGVFAEKRALGKILKAFSFLAKGIVCYPLYVVAFIFWPAWSDLVGQVVIADLCGLLLLIPLRYIVRRPRPPQRREHHYMVPWNNYSFPSGHAVRAFAIATTLVCIAAIWGTILAALATVIAFSRITLARHYPSDVLAGVGIGIVAGLAASQLSGHLFG